MSKEIPTIGFIVFVVGLIVAVVCTPFFLVDKLNTVQPQIQYEINSHEDTDDYTVTVKTFAGDDIQGIKVVGPDNTGVERQSPVKYVIPFSFITESKITVTIHDIENGETIQVYSLDGDLISSREITGW